jgi:hypothetical protein
MENPEVAQIFDEVADLLELQTANPKPAAKSTWPDKENCRR